MNCSLTAINGSIKSIYKESSNIQRTHKNCATVFVCVCVRILFSFFCALAYLINDRNEGWCHLAVHFCHGVDVIRPNYRCFLSFSPLSDLRFICIWYCRRALSFTIAKWQFLLGSFVVYRFAPNLIEWQLITFNQLNRIDFEILPVAKWFILNANNFLHCSSLNGRFSVRNGNFQTRAHKSEIRIHLCIALYLFYKFDFFQFVSSNICFFFVSNT